MEIKKIVFTGGPCAGKTTIINEVSKTLKDDGYYVINVEETATQFIGAMIMPHADREHTLKFQDYVYRLQSVKEKIAEEYAEGLAKSNLDLIKDKKGIVIIYDRGIMDNRAYLPHEDYNVLLERHNCNEISTMDKYDLVIDLVSLATTNPELYVLDGIRYETVKQAAKLDQATSSAWLLHRNLKVIKPTEKVEEKIQIVLKNIYNLLENKKKEDIESFVLDRKHIDLSKYNNENSRKIKINYVTCYDNDDRKFVLLKRQYNGKVSFVRDDVPSVFYRNSSSKPISYEEYIEALSLSKIHISEEKEVLSIIYSGIKFDLIETEKGLLILETDSKSMEQVPEDIKRYIKRKISKYNESYHENV